MPDRCRRRCRRLPRTLAAVRRPAVRARARLMAACAAMVIGLAARPRPARPGPERCGASSVPPHRRGSSCSRCPRRRWSGRSGSGSTCRPATIGRRAAPLPGVLFQRRPGPVRLEPFAAELGPALAADIAARNAWYGSWQLEGQLERAVAAGRLPPMIVVGIASDDGLRSRDLAPVPWLGSERAAASRMASLSPHRRRGGRPPLLAPSPPVAAGASAVRP